MAVRDHGIEAIRKSADQVVPGDNTEHYLKTKIIDSIPFTPSGLRTDFKTTTLSIGTTASKIPAAPLSERNSLIIFNTDSTETLYLGKSGVTADQVNGTTSGWQIEAGAYFSTDVTDDIEFYGVVANGSVQVQVLEVS